MVELADTQLSKSCLPKEGVGSTPTHGTNNMNKIEARQLIPSIGRSLDNLSTALFRENKEPAKTSSFTGQDGNDYQTPEAMERANEKLRSIFRGNIFDRTK